MIPPNRATRFFLFFLSVLFIFSIAAPGKGRGIPQPLSRALHLLGNDKPAEALEQVEEFIAEGKDHPYYTAAELIAGRCEIALGKYTRAVNRTLSLIHHYPASNNLAKAYYLLATGYQGRGDYYEAAQALIECIDVNPDGRERKLAEERLRELAEGPVLNRLRLLREMANTSVSREVLDGIGAGFESAPWIGLLLQDESEGVSVSLSQGLLAAVELYNAESEPGIEIVQSPVFGSEVDAVLATRRMIREKGVWSIIAGCGGRFAVPVAVEAQAAGVPVLLPGIRRPGVFAVGKGVILPEADWYREGEIAARYALDSLGLKTFAIVAPATEMAKDNVGGFIDAVEERDSTEIVALEWYFPTRGVSLSRQFTRVREIGFFRQFADSMRAEGETGDSAKFARLWKKHLADIRISTAYKSGAIDSNDIELSSIEGFYFPIEPGTMELFAPQFAFYNFRTLRFGNSAWYRQEELHHNREYVDEMIFTAPCYLDADNDELRKLTGYLRDSLQVELNSWHIRGYDCGQLLVSRIREGYTGPGELADGLWQLTSADLAAGRQTFDTRRHTGKSMWLLTVIEGEIVPESKERRLQLISPVSPEPEE